MAFRGRTPAQRCVRRPLPREQCDRNTYHRVYPFWPVVLDDITGFRVELRRTVVLQSGARVSFKPGTYDVPVPTGPWDGSGEA